jgi:putative SOS response-associated peptidase YedK
MCGRFITGADEMTWAEYRDRLTLVTAARSLETRECYPGTPVPMVYSDEATKGERHLVTARWGFAPPKNLDIPASRVIFNLRDDRLHKTFPRYTEGGRCLLPAAGFYEWKKRQGQKKKQGFRLGLRHHPLFSFAGVWKREDRTRGPRKAEGKETLQQAPSPSEGSLVCSLLTTSPNEEVAPIHHRMPVILLGDEADAWLSADASAGELEQLLKPCEAPMEIRTLEPPAKEPQLSLF